MQLPQGRKLREWFPGWIGNRERGIGNGLPVATEVVPDSLGGVPGDGRLDVAVGVEGDLDAGVAQAFLDHLGMDPRLQSEGRGGVPEVVVVPTSA